MSALLSTAATKALIDVGTYRQGARIPHTVSAGVAQELQDAGLIGRSRGLTRRGTITRQRIVDTTLNVLL